MRAVVLSEPGPAENLQIRDLPIPEPRAGWVRIAVQAFGLNRSEPHLRRGLADGARFPIVPGIEAVGTLDAAPGSDLRPGQQVAALMGGMGRDYDRGYAEYTIVPRGLVIPFRSDLPWAVLGSVPETLQTTHGSLTTGLDLRGGQRLLIRGGTSALGFAAAALAHEPGRHGAGYHPPAGPVGHPGGTRRRPPDPRRWRRRGSGPPHRTRRSPCRAGTGGTPTLPPDTLAATRVHGTVCYAGMLSDQWTVPDFYPIAYLPTGVRLTAYGGGAAADLPSPVLQHYLDRIADGSLHLEASHTYRIDQIREAHQAMDTNTVNGKLVVLTGSEP